MQLFNRQNNLFLYFLSSFCLKMTNYQYISLGKQSNIRILTQMLLSVISLFKSLTNYPSLFIKENTI